MTLLSEIYDVTLKRGIRGKAKENLIRPTVSEFFMSNHDFEEIESSTYNGINPAYSGFPSSMYAWARTYAGQSVYSKATATYPIPAGFTFRQANWTGGFVSSGFILDDGTTLEDQGSVGVWACAVEPNILPGDAVYMEFQPSGGYSAFGIAAINNDNRPHETEYGYQYDYTGRFIHNGAQDTTPDNFGAGTIIGVAVDLIRGYIWWSKNGVWQVNASGGGIPNFDY